MTHEEYACFLPFDDNKCEISELKVLSTQPAHCSDRPLSGAKSKRYPDVPESVLILVLFTTCTSGDVVKKVFELDLSLGEEEGQEYEKD